MMARLIKFQFSRTLGKTLKVELLLLLLLLLLLFSFI